MRQIQLAIVIAGITACMITPATNACTGIRLKAEDGSVVHARTVEFGTPLDIRLLIIPRGIAMDGSAVDGIKSMTWISKYGTVGVNTHGSPAALDGLNEAGVAAGTFYFPDYADYPAVTTADDGKVVHPINFVNYLLTNFATVAEVRQAIGSIKVSGAKLEGWDDTVPPLHWIVHDRSGASVVIEPVGGKLVIHDNPLGVMVNSPTFDWHMTNLRNFIHLKPYNVPPVKLQNLTFKPLGQGSGLAGMPGDFTPPSRFIRAVVYSQTLFPVKTGREAVLEAFHVLNQFDIPRGAAVGVHEGKPEADITQATVAADLKGLKYYAHNYDSRRIQMIDMNEVNFEANKIIQVDLPSEEVINDVTPKP